MGRSHELVTSETTSNSDATTERPIFSWPLAVAIIGCASVGLWLVIFRVSRLLLGS